MARTFRNPSDVECCATCDKPLGPLTGTERLFMAAKRVDQYFEAKCKGQYFWPNEDLEAARELRAALNALQGEAQARELVDRR